MTNTPKRVARIDPATGGVVSTYPSISHAARDAGVTATAVRRAALNGTVCAGYRWRIDDRTAEDARPTPPAPAPVIRSGGGLPDQRFDNTGDAVRWLQNHGHPSADASNILAGADLGRVRYGYEWRRDEPDPADMRARLMREGMGLTADWMAARQGVTITTIYARERTGRLPRAAADDLAALKRRFDDEVRRIADTARRTGVITIPDDPAMPDSWHRMAAARALGHTPTARVTRAEPAHGQEHAT